MTKSIYLLVPHTIGFCASDKFEWASLFADDRSNFAFIHFQKSSSTNETILAKQTYEAELKNIVSKLFTIMQTISLVQ